MAGGTVWFKQLNRGKREKRNNTLGWNRYVLLASLMIFRAIRLLLNAELYLNILLFMVWYCSWYYLHQWCYKRTKSDRPRVRKAFLVCHYTLFLLAVASPGFVTSFSRLYRGLQTSPLNWTENSTSMFTKQKVCCILRLAVSCLKLTEYIVAAFDDQYFCYDFDLFRS